MQAVCLASGPSLTQEDVDLVKGWRDNTPDGFVIAANTTFRIAPWADAMFAMDPKWWKVHYREVCDVFEGERFTTATLDSRFALTRLDRFSNYRNSGAACIALAAMKGADRIVMLGYDCMKDGQDCSAVAGDLRPAGEGHAAQGCASGECFATHSIGVLWARGVAG